MMFVFPCFEGEVDLTILVAGLAVILMLLLRYLLLAWPSSSCCYYDTCCWLGRHPHAVTTMCFDVITHVCCF